MGRPTHLVLRTKGQLATGILAEAFAAGVRLDYVCGDEVCGSCTELRQFLGAHGQACVLRVASSRRAVGRVSRAVARDKPGDNRWSSRDNGRRG
jgi:hypothetical protein